MFNIFDHMQPSTLAEIVAAGLTMNTPTEEDQAVYQRARSALVSNQGEKTAQKMIVDALDDLD